MVIQVNNIENMSLNIVTNLETKEIDDTITKFVNNIHSIYKNNIPTIIRFRLFDSNFDYYVENQLLRTKLGNTNLEIAKGENGVKIIEDINSVTRDLNKSDAITKLIEYQKEKKIACNIISFFYVIIKIKKVYKYVSRII